MTACVPGTGVWFVYHCLIERKRRKRFPFLKALFTSAAPLTLAQIAVQRSAVNHT